MKTIHDYKQLVEVLKECNDCLCEHCPHIKDKHNLVKCMNDLIGDAATALEELVNYIQDEGYYFVLKEKKGESNAGKC